MSKKIKLGNTQGALITETTMDNDFIQKITTTFKSLEPQMLFKEIHKDAFLKLMDTLTEREFNEVKRGNNTWSGQTIVEQNVFTDEEITFKKAYCFGGCSI